MKMIAAGGCICHGEDGHSQVRLPRKVPQARIHHHLRGRCHHHAARLNDAHSSCDTAVPAVRGQYPRGEAGGAEAQG